MDQLEVPGEGADHDWPALYLYRGDEVPSSRPIFTGDVFKLPDETGLVQLVQHPCALRTNGVELVSPLLVTTVKESQPLKRSQWKGNYKQFPLPELTGEEGPHYSSYFHELTLVEYLDTLLSHRVACLSQHGVNLLIQRWVHHNSRVVVPTTKIDQVTAAQFEEADLIEYWCESFETTEISNMEAQVGAHNWLRSDSGNGKTWQDLLIYPQHRSKIRSAMRKEIKKQTASFSSSSLPR